MDREREMKEIRDIGEREILERLEMLERVE